MLYLALLYEREAVARELIRLGADVDEIGCKYDDGNQSTAVDASIMRGRPSQLSICHRLGASMSAVIREDGGNTWSALGLALRQKQLGCLSFLLDEVLPARPVALDREETRALGYVVDAGSFREVKDVCEALRTRGFDFRKLNDCFAAREGDRCRNLFMSDWLLAKARTSERAGLLSYFVKELGLMSRKNVQEQFVNAGFFHNSPEPSASSSLAPLTKFECASCNSLAATMLCSGCRVARYCSKDCSRVHWKEVGGHKKECREIQRRAASGPSQL